MSENHVDSPITRVRSRTFSLATLLAVTAFIGLGLAYSTTRARLQEATAELNRLRLETGYLAETESGQIAAVRVPSDEPLTYRLRVRVPESRNFRVAYSSLWPVGASAPEWFAAVDVPPGESLVTVQILEDPRDQQWKITTIIRSERGTKRVATVLPPPHVVVFRQSHDAVSTGVGRQTIAALASESIRLLDERWVVGEGGLLLYGDRSPEQDQIGVYAELQPDDHPL
jgi:hypothetical protein